MTLGLFEGYGIEVEYMIVDRQSLAVRPLCENILRRQNGGDLACEIEVGPLAWSNELCAHLVELKTNGPAKSLQGLEAKFLDHVGIINRLLEPDGAMLMPTGMHPLMNPDKEMVLWPHGYGPVYEAFNRIFDCRGHGWSNLQSVHINLPFSGDEEFGRLHAAIRLILPILPALAASTPVMEGRATGFADTRLNVYRSNARRVPIVSGRVIPEPVFDRRSYEQDLLGKLYEAISPLDPEGLLQEEWLNARGAIARFDRMAIEIRLIDVQECPAADFAVVQAVVSAVRALVEERNIPWEAQKAFSVDRLFPILISGIDKAEAALIEDAGYLAAFGLKAERATAGALWRHMAHDLGDASAVGPALRNILDRGSLSTRILRALGPDFDRSKIEDVYRRLAGCLSEGRIFEA